MYIFILLNNNALISLAISMQWNILNSLNNVNGIICIHICVYSYKLDVYVNIDKVV